MKKFLISALLFATFFYACKEDDTVIEEPIIALTTAEKIQHKWDLVSIIDHNYVGTSTTLDYKDTIVIGAGNFMDFRSDNKVYSSMDGDLDTVPYQIVNDQTILFDGDVFTISSLTTTDFIFKYEERTDDPYFDNIVTLSR
jgi:hypothetical protein